MRKRILSLALAIVLLMAAVPVAVANNSPTPTAGYYEAIPPKYDVARSFNDGLAAVNIGGTGPHYSGGRWGFVDKTGKEVIPLQYDYVYDFSEGLAAVQLDGKWGFIDVTGKEVIPLTFDGARGGFSEGLAVINIGGTHYSPVWGSGGKWGYIDKTGKIVIEAKYDGWGTDFSEGLALTSDGYIDKTGKVVISSPLYWGADSFSDGMAPVMFSNVAVGQFYTTYGYIDKTGEVVIPEGKYYRRSSHNYPKFSNGLAFVSNIVFSNGEQEAGYIDKTGEMVISGITWGAAFSEGLAEAYKVEPGIGEGRGFIDTTGEFVIPRKYDYVKPFNEGTAAVCINKKWGFIDKSDNVIVPFVYDGAWASFSEGMAAVNVGGTTSSGSTSGGKWGFIALGDPPEPEEPTGSLSNFERVKVYDGRFTDMNWSHEWVAKAYEYGIIAGTSATTYGTTGNMSIQDALVVASKIHAIYYTGTDAAATDGARYPTSYINYAIENGIIDKKFEGRYTEPATRAELAHIWGNVLPKSELKIINTYVPVTDVETSHPYHDSIKLFYEAGIVTGSPDGKFNPNNPINRGECAVMFVRLVSEVDRNGYKG